MPGKEWSIPQEANNILLIFLRAPELGQVKTRLAKEVGDEKALSLYKALAEKVMSAARIWKAAGAEEGEIRKIWLCYTPEGKRELIQNWLGREDTLLAQSGSGLDQRMANAMISAFEAGAEKAVLVGTDVPDIKADHLEEGFAVLDNTPAVLGPTFDGGYWLVGSRASRFSKEIFRDIPWSTEIVLEKTTGRFRELGLEYTLVAQLRDVDNFEDLERTGFKGDTGLLKG